MNKPKSYHIEQCPTSEGYMQARLDLECVHEKDYRKYIVINTCHDIFLKPRSARAIAKRLLAMADWVEMKGGE